MDKTKLYHFLIFSLLFLLMQISICLASENLSQSNEIKANLETSETKQIENLIAPQLMEKCAAMIKSEPTLILVDKSRFTLYLFKNGAEVKNYKIAIGLNPGQKRYVGDMTTPIGEFSIEDIVDSSNWTHDFNDGKGEIIGAYGPWFISLATGWDGIGIHGTHNSDSIGTKATEGCIRMLNHEVDELKNLIAINTKVIIID